MNLIDTLKPSSYRPNLSKAVLVSFSQAEDFDETMPKQISYETLQKLIALRERKSEFKKEYLEWSKRRKVLNNAVKRSRASLNRAHSAMDIKKVRDARESLNFNLKRLEVWDAEKPVFGG